MTKRALVCALMPEFDRDSGSRRVLDLVDLLGEAGFAVTFVSHHADCRSRYVHVLQQRGVAVYAGAATHMPPLIESGLFDVAVFALWHIAEPFIQQIRSASPHTRIVVDSVDLHFLRLARQRFRERRNGKTASLDDTYGAELVRELNTYDAADAVLTVSQKEADVVNDWLGRGTAFTVPDCEDLQASPVSLKRRRGILFVGCFRHPPNADAVRYLCQEVLPLVDERVRSAHPVQIVGDGLSDEVRHFGRGVPSVRMVGWVPSVVPYFEHARLTVLPLQYGAGTKRKLLQALMIGTPAVSTSIGAEGFGLASGTQLLLADDPATFAASITRLAEDDPLWRHLVRSGRSHILARHGRKVVRTAVKKMLDVVLASESRRSPASIGRGPHETQSDHEGRVSRVRGTIAQFLPAGAIVAVASRGDATLVKLDGMTGWHFPAAPSGEYAGHDPADGEEAVELVRAIALRGARYLVFPAAAAWWTERYPELGRYLSTSAREVAREPGNCVIYALNGDTEQTAPMPVEVQVPASVQSDAPREIHLVSPPRSEPSPSPVDAVRLIAFFLPQFHPIPENDAWWGHGFTEWTNVMRARPLFPGHHQPHMPADLGFYDLRLAETREKQAELARAHGLHGFCYYHYWFSGKMLLERPFNDVLHSGRPDLPFCLCWANEPWSRRWDGRPREILQPQAYSLDDDRRHIQWLMPALADPRAITIEGKPVFIVYQARELPHPARTVDIWRHAVERAGLKGLYLLAVETAWDAGWDATSVGFDAKVLFQPQFSTIRGVSQLPVSVAGLAVYDYAAAWPILAKRQAASYRRYSTVFPSWDNTARKGTGGVALHQATPAAYEAWLRQEIAAARREPPEHQVVFINAWNEWAEGCHLEPDTRHGRGFLEATARAVRMPALVTEHRPRAASIVSGSGEPRRKRSGRRSASHQSGTGIAADRVG
jgi:glycosyltransferase involved in cell wall biosynthesis